MDISLDKNLFKELYPYIIDDNVTDIRWNGRALWIEDLQKGRYKSNVILTDDFLNIFTSTIATRANVNFNQSESSLQAETPELRIHAIHPSRTGDHTYVLAIRKTPAVARINDYNIVKQGYTNNFVRFLLRALVQGHCSGIIIGDVGAGKTELEKYMASFLPDNETCMTVEDTLEMKLPELYPWKDISAVKISSDYTTEQAIRDALRLLVKYLLIAEARGREIARIIEGASTGCTAITTIHATNVWEIPDRVVQMAGQDVDANAFENDVFTFFDFGIKVAKKVTDHGIQRKIDQICFFDRQNKHNKIYVFMKNGEFTGELVPDAILEKFNQDDEQTKEVLDVLEGLKARSNRKEK